MEASVSLMLWVSLECFDELGAVCFTLNNFCLYCISPGIMFACSVAWRVLQLLSLFCHPGEEFGLVNIKLLCSSQFMYLLNVCAMTNTTKAESFDMIMAWESLSRS